MTSLVISIPFSLNHLCRCVIFHGTTSKIFQQKQEKYIQYVLHGANGGRRWEVKMTVLVLIRISYTQQTTARTANITQDQIWQSAANNYCRLQTVLERIVSLSLMSVRDQGDKMEKLFCHKIIFRWLGWRRIWSLRHYCQQLDSFVLPHILRILRNPPVRNPAT